ncbi:hypothetical protein L596_027884 [Steinernema carpocapsae]|uniref:Uncharacterized protein n=1 Tax=Steinernema carpocapsae TaxID=34508 RepID=A0A4U5LWW0_STECR|nr:hypothetical protein L596_027884 [Steinernema carpocapsae]
MEILCGVLVRKQFERLNLGRKIQKEEQKSVFDRVMAFLIQMDGSKMSRKEAIFNANQLTSDDFNVPVNMLENDPNTVYYSFEHNGNEVDLCYEWRKNKSVKGTSNKRG